MGDTEEPTDTDEMGSNKKSAAVKKERSPSPCGSSSSGEIKDDSDAEIEGTVCTTQTEATRNGHVEYRRSEREKEHRASRASGTPPRRFDPENDYRRPHLSSEQIYVRVRKIPTPDILIDLTDEGLRRLVADVHELGQEQNRFSNNRRKLLDQMRQMHKQELGSLRECMETLRRLMTERGMNLLATPIGQDVMEFLHEKDQNVGAGTAQLPVNIPASSSESCPGSFGVFPSAPSFAQNRPLPRPHFPPEQPTSLVIPQFAPPVLPGPHIVPFPDFSVPPPFTGPPPRAGKDQTFEGPGTSTMKDAGATSSISAPSLSIPKVEGGALSPFRNLALAGTSERAVEMAGPATSTQVPRNGAMGPEKSGLFGPAPQMASELEHPGMVPGMPPPLLALMRAQRLGMPPFRDGTQVMDSVRGAPPFPDERGMPLSNSRIVSLYDDGRLPFHEYEHHPQGDETIRIRHVWSTRPLNIQRRMVQQAGFRDRDRKMQRRGNAADIGRTFAAEMRDRSRSPLDRSKTAAANCKETGTTNDSATDTLSNAAGIQMTFHDKKIESGIGKID